MAKIRNLPSNSAPIQQTDLAPGERFGDLWNKAVSEYETTLSAKAKKIYQRTKTPEDAFNFTTDNWQKTINDEQSRYHTKVKEVVTQVMSVMGLINSALGLASTVRFSYWSTLNF